MERQNEWKSFLKTPFKNCRYIYPIQQKKVEKMINHLKNNDNVIKIIVFGSSETSKCLAGRDVDFYVEVKEDKRIITDYLDFLYDLWTNYTVDENMKKEIFKKGVVVYERE